MSWREAMLCPVVALQAAMEGKAIEDRQQWETARWLNYTAVMLSPFIKNRPASPMAYHRFPWENGAETTPEPFEMTAEMQNELFRIIEIQQNKSKS